MKWMVLGSSPTAVSFYERARLDTDILVTCNSGIYLARRPDYYIVHDTFSIRKFCQWAGHAATNGTKIVTTQWKEPHVRSSFQAWCKSKNIDHEPFAVPYFTIPIEESDTLADDQLQRQLSVKYKPGEYVHAGYTGMFMLQFAANNAKSGDTIHLVGMEGYGEGSQYFDRDDVKESNIERTQAIGRFTVGLINACPHLQFVFWGVPNYEVCACRDNAWYIGTSLKPPIALPPGVPFWGPEYDK